MSDKVYLVDGSGYIFRAYYAVSPLSTSAGMPTNALLGYVRMLLKLLKQAESKNVVVVFDAGKETFRNELYSEYKANRSECPEDLLVQMPYFRELAQAMGLTVLELPGYEADDVIGTLTRRLTRLGKEVVIVTGDKDLMQLVSDKVHIWDTMKDQRYFIPDVKEKWGVEPEALVEVLGLMGDSSDNIPGLSGVGPKTAAQLVQKFGTVERIIDSVDQIRQDSSIRNRNKICDQIESAKEILRLSRKLVELNAEAPVHIEISENRVLIEQLQDNEFMTALGRKAPRRELLRGLVEKLEFNSVLNDFDYGDFDNSDEAATKVPASDFSYRTIYKSDFADWLQIFLAQKVFSFDLVTSSLDFTRAEIVGAAFCWSDTQAFYIPFSHTEGDDVAQQLSRAEFFSACSSHFADPEVFKLGQNLKFDLNVLAYYGLPVSGIAFDTMLAGYILNPDKRSYSRSSLAREFLNLESGSYDEVVPEGSDFSVVPIDIATRYACQDAHHSWLLKNRFVSLLKEANLEKIYYDVELPLLSVLAAMELRGVKIDAQYLRQMSDEFSSTLEGLKKRIFDLAGTDFNINSPRQLADVLFNRLNISTKGIKKTKTGISTDSSVLEKLVNEHPIPGLILEYRLLHKLKSTYLDALPELISPVTGRLHTTYNQTIAATGRLSSTDPNLQNIPVQTAEGRRIRNAFVPEQGKVLISADYSQIELRLLAHMSNDERLIEAFTNGTDIHAETARDIMGVPPGEEVSAEDRRIGKTINFGIIYGMSGFRLGNELGIPVGVANKYIENYFAKYPGVNQFFAFLEEQAKSQGYVTTLFGRKRFIGDIDSSGRGQGFLLRAAINAPIQGSAADLIKLAMINIERRTKLERLPVEMIMQIHDELVFEADAGAVSEIVSVIVSEMESVADLSVPLKVDIGWGENWQTAKS